MNLLQKELANHHILFKNGKNNSIINYYSITAKYNPIICNNSIIVRTTTLIYYLIEVRIIKLLLYYLWQEPSIHSIIILMYEPSNYNTIHLRI